MLELITDRTGTDVLLGNEKGTYAFSDLNRVEAAVKELNELLPKLDISLSLETKTDWALPGDFSARDWPTEAQMKRYLANVKAIRDALSVTAQLPESMRKLTWTDANNIEKALIAAEVVINSVLQTFRYSGEIYSGEEFSL